MKRAVTQLARTLRYTLRSGHDELVSLERELEIAEAASSDGLEIALGGQTIVQAEQGEIGSEGIGLAAAVLIDATIIRGVLLPVGNGRQVPLTDVATVEDTHQEQRLWARLDGVPAVKLSIRKQPNANTVAVAEGIESKLEQIEAFYLAGLARLRGG